MVCPNSVILKLMRLSALALLAVLASAQDLSRELPGIILDIRTTPIAVRSGGQYLLQYEMQITNASTKTMTIQRIDVSGPETLLVLEGEALAKAFPEGFTAKAVVPGVQSTGVLLAFSVDRVPASLTHRIRFQVGDNPEPLTVEQPATPVRLNTLRIHPPLSGDKWIALNGPAGNNHHTGGFMPYQGRVHVPQRFAIDFVQLEANGETHHGNAKDNRNYRCYGAQAVAVASGLVVEVRDGISENVPDPEKRAVPMTLDTVSGNHVVLDLGHGRFAHYAHFQPGSIRVHKGDRVRLGQVIGLVGNSGNSTEPHLHFQITDGPGILGSDGLPYELVTFVHDGQRVRNELPRNRWVVDF
jgi:murein DD-endopeptidase MepM/ murein hydrolase activator NlpD